MKKWLAAALLLAVLGASWFWLGKTKEAEPQNSAATGVVSRRSLEMVVEAAGQVEPIREIEVKSRASGEVLEVLVETGDFVKKGSLLARIDPRDVENAWQQAVADLDSASVRFDIADAQRKRMEALKDSEVITVQELETSLQAAASARAELVRARTNLQLARERRHDATIRAPADGTVIERTVEPGQIIASAISNVSGGTTLFRMADLSHMQVRANVDETDISQVVPGLKVRVSVDAWPNRDFEGLVHKVEPLALEEQNVTTFPVLVRLDNPKGMLKPGMNAEITVEVERRDQVLAVPNGAVVGPRDVVAAGIALGLPPDALRAHLRRPGASGNSGERGGAGVPGKAEGQGREESGSREVAGMAASPSVQVDSEVESPVTALSGSPEGMTPDFAGNSGSAPRAADVDGQEGAESASSSRPAVVFVRDEAGKVEPRRVLVGLSDWEHSEVISGLKEGQQVMLVSVAQLKKAQAEAQERFRSRMGNRMMPGMGRR